MRVLVPSETLRVAKHRLAEHRFPTLTVKEFIPHEGNPTNTTLPGALQDEWLAEVSLAVPPWSLSLSINYSEKSLRP